MNLQYGCDKCEKLHIGKKQNEDICQTITIDSWGKKVVQNKNGIKEIIDVFKGKEALSEVFEKKYLGDVIAKNGKNTSNIKERTNRGHGTINKIVTTLNERSYGRHQFKAAMLMRGSMLVGGMLNNAECWINITQKDLENLETPEKKILSTKGSPSKCFIQLELGIIPIRFILKQKRLNFLHYILNEDKNSMISQVFFEMKKR